MTDIARAQEAIAAGNISLGVEFGSTRIKAVLIDEQYNTLAQGDHVWEKSFRQWIMDLRFDEVWAGVQDAYAQLVASVHETYDVELTRIVRMGFSAMMHGYLAFNKNGELLVPFRTWRNTNTHEAHEQLSELFQFNIPERWSIAHLYQAILNNEEHVPEVDFFTTPVWLRTLATHRPQSTRVGDASGMFPIDPHHTTSTKNFSHNSSNSTMWHLSHGIFVRFCQPSSSPARMRANSLKKERAYSIQADAYRLVLFSLHPRVMQERAW